MAIKDMDFSKIEEAGAIRKEIKRQYYRGRMTIVHVIGLPGTGKSWACLRLGELVSQDLHGANEISIENVVDNLLDLLKFIRRVKKRGEIVIAEEIGVWLSSKRAMSAVNVDAGMIWDTIRKKGIIVFANNPINKDVDKKLLALSSMQVQTLSLNKRIGVTLLKPLRLQTNPDTAKTYRHRLKKNGRDVHRCWIGKPDKTLTDAYEDSKDKFLEELYERLQKKHQDRRDKELGLVASKMGEVTQIESRRKGLYERGMSFAELAKIEGVTDEAVRKSVRSYESKISNLFKSEKTQRGNTATPQLKQ